MSSYPLNRTGNSSHRDFWSGFLLLVCVSTFAFTGCGAGASYIRPGEPHPVNRTTSDPGEEVYTIYLLGDAGYADETNSAPMLAVENEAAQNPGHSLVVYLGDNVYSSGMPAKGDPERERAEDILTAQLNVMVNSGAKGLMIPGNHDWGGMGEEGMTRLGYQQEFVDEFTASHAGARVEFFPRDAQPGPVAVVENDIFSIIALDAQWWLHQYDKPLYPGAATIEETQALIVDSLRRLTGGYGGVTILLTHNPLETHGPHGGFFTWKDHIFPLTNLEPWLWLPLPVLGSAYPLARSNGFSPQDVSNGLYSRYVSEITSALEGAGPVIVASGHEHSLQVIHAGENILNLVSGSGILDHSSAVSAGDHTLFASEMAGYMVVSIYIDGSVRLKVKGVSDASSGPELLYTRLLVESSNGDHNIP